MIDGIVGNSTAKRDEVPSYQTSIRHNGGCHSRWCLGLLEEQMATTPHSDEDGYEIGYPTPTLPSMQSPEAQQRHDKTDHDDDNDSDVDADVAGVDGGEGLSSNNGCHQREASDGGSIEKQWNNDNVQSP